MNTLIFAAGIYLSARIISFIAGELTEAEIDKQKEIRDTIEDIRSWATDDLEFEEEELQNGEEYLKVNEEISDYLISEVVARKENVDSLIEELKSTRREVVSAIRAKDVVQTPLRRSSLEMLLRQLSGALEKVYAYRQYLESYSEELILKRNEEHQEFFMRLPSNYPYVGKVLWVNAEQLTENIIRYEFQGFLSLQVRITDVDVCEIAEKGAFPIMITRSGKEYTASIEKGAFKAHELTNTHLGVSATVSEIQDNYVVLTYLKDLELFLPKRNLIKPDRFPPIQSSLTVYPIKWEYDLDYYSYDSGKKGYPVAVSERKEDATSSFTFDSFPICFSEQEYKTFRQYYEDNNLQDYDEEFLIGPVNQEAPVIKKGSRLKLQYGDIPLFYIEIDEQEERTDIFRYYFRFQGLCGSEERTFSADDIFVPFDVSIAPYFDGTSTDMIQHCMGIDDIDDVAALIWDLIEEFRIQYQIRSEREGMGYFFKWESITNQLITVLEQGDSIVVNVQWIAAQGKNTVFAEVLDVDSVVEFIRQTARKNDVQMNREWKPSFFVKDEMENRYVTTFVDGGRRIRIEGKNASLVFRKASKELELFVSNRPYAEYQQKTALRQFRTGQVANSKIQAACLNSATIICDHSNTKELVPFHNAALERDVSQKVSVERAFMERNIFLIQGPPGTGKTTVIRELVEQVIDTDDRSRVLIVSQANVAVDNALSGLVEKYGDLTVRCGNGNKITEKLQNLRLQSRCQDYLDDLSQRKQDFDESFYNSWENTITSNDTYDYSPALCELIIRNHRLIGATCVGLAKQNIGLERTEFDLVIIDEAGKALPAELLIPLIRARKAVIIGDHKQLPPIINPILYDEEKIDLEERVVSENDLFCHSLFERLYDRAPNSSKMMLNTQYRMPAVIGTAISELFYDGKLKNGIGTEEKKPVLFDSNISFINYDGKMEYAEQKDSRRQITNEVEARAVVSLVMSIRKKDPTCKIAVITPYKGQKRLISNALISHGIHYQINEIYVDTIDSFQGSEADVVLFCTTRGNRATTFFRDNRRLNVALSRAKRELIILGRLRYFYKYSRTESCLPALADYIKKNGKIISADSCRMVAGVIGEQNATKLMISICDISLPMEYYTGKIDKKEIRLKISEFYVNGDFLQPLIVRRTPTGFVLNGGFEQFKAACELGLNECLCRVQ